MGTHSKLRKKLFFNAEAKPSSERYLIKNAPPFIFADLEYDYRLFRKRATLKDQIKITAKRIILSFFGTNGLEKIKKIISR